MFALPPPSRFLMLKSSIRETVHHILEKHRQNTTSLHISHFNPQTHSCRKTIVILGQNMKIYSISESLPFPTGSHLL